jgi:iron complex outermembrane receptor protein
VPATARKTASGQAAKPCGSSPATAVPKHRASLWLDYRFESAIKVGVGARHTGTNFGDCGYGNCYYGDQRTVVGTATYRW